MPIEVREEGDLMDFIVNQPDPLLDSFFDNFERLWSRPNQAQGFRSYVLGLVCQLHRKNIEAISAKVVGQQYQSLHHFLSDAPWDADILNRIRIDALMANRRTAPSGKGVLIIDDTGVPKRGRSTEGVKRQYIGQLGKTANGQVFVTSHYADERLHWPIDERPYVPDVWFEKGKEDPAFKTKPTLALELIDSAVAMGIKFRAVVVDSWYGRNVQFLKELENRNLPYVAELDGSQRIFARLPGDLDSHQHRLKEALCLLKPKDFRPADITNADGTKRSRHVAQVDVKIKGLPGKRRVVVVTTRPDDPGSDDDLRWLTANVVELRSDTVARVYALRNWVEEFYKEAKDDLGAGQYQVRGLESIVRHWHMVFVAYSLLVTLKREGRVQRWCKKTPHREAGAFCPARLPLAEGNTGLAA